MSRSTPVALRPVEIHILLSVVDRPRHGYAILQEAEARTGGRPGFEMPTFYRAIQRLRTAGLIQAAAGDPEADERREYWQATRLGRQALEAELKRLEVVVAVGRARMGHAGAGGRK
ncbi:MAG TPA: helix-turn-helix transcriptional regulator [Vicinamibacterales bacterium]|nr:helix-turn-helix transcriptional regulator [Vicinamibacterales bacterium]